MEHWRKQSDQVTPEKQLSQIVETYLSAVHRDNPGHGCSIPALGAEIARESPKTRKAFAGKLDEMIEMITDFIPNLPRKAARKQAIATLATMAGTMLLARIAGSSELSDEVLKTGKDSALDGARHEPKAAAAKRRSRARLQSPQTTPARAPQSRKYNPPPRGCVRGPCCRRASASRRCG